MRRLYSVMKGPTVMLYCPACQRMAIDKCPHCGRPPRRLREIRENDPVLVFNAGFIPATFVEPLLADNNIPYSKEGILGAGLTTKAGGILERFNFFVPYAAYTETVRLITDTFTNSPDILCGLEIPDGFQLESPQQTEP